MFTAAETKGGREEEERAERDRVQLGEWSVVKDREKGERSPVDVRRGRRRKAF